MHDNYQIHSENSGEIPKKFFCIGIRKIGDFKPYAYYVRKQKDGRNFWDYNPLKARQYSQLNYAKNGYYLLKFNYPEDSEVVIAEIRMYLNSVVIRDDVSSPCK